MIILFHITKMSITNVYYTTRLGQLLKALETREPKVIASETPTVSVQIGDQTVEVKIAKSGANVGTDLLSGVAAIFGGGSSVNVEYKFEGDDVSMSCSLKSINQNLDILDAAMQKVHEYDTPVVVSPVVVAPVVAEPVVAEPVVVVPVVVEPVVAPVPVAPVVVASGCTCGHCEDYDDEDFEDDDEEEIVNLFEGLSNEETIRAVLATLSEDAKSAFRDIIVTPTKIEHPADFPSLTDDMYAILTELVFLNDSERALKIMEL